jgi:hypothetical protein
MEHRDENSRAWLPLVLYAVPLIIPIWIFFWARSNYVSDSFIDSQLGTLLPEESMWLPVLMGIPLVGQIICMTGLIARAKKDKSLNRFYISCLGMGYFGTSSYCLLWLLYTKGFHSSGFWSYMALGLICVLVLTVGAFTFLFVRLPERKVRPASSALKESDIKNKGALCTKLKRAKDSGSPEYLIKIFNALGLNERNAIDNINIKDGHATNELKDVNLSKLVNDLNVILSEPTFFSQNDLDEMNFDEEILSLWGELSNFNDPLSSEQKKQVCFINRRILEACFSDRVIAPVIKETFLDELKTGLSKAPFIALIFFLTVFLDVSFLFGFAFAFDDKARVQTYGEPALFKAGSHPEGLNDYSFANRESSQSTSGSNQTTRSTTSTIRHWPEFTFYFVPGTTDLNSRSTDYKFNDYDSLLNEWHSLNGTKNSREREIESLGWIPGRLPKGFGRGNLSEVRRKLLDKSAELEDAKDKIEKLKPQLSQATQLWENQRNSDHTSQLVTAIEREAVLGRGVLLELKASFEPAAANISLIELVRHEEEMARNVKYLLLQKLSERTTIPRQLEWFYLPSVNKLPLVPLPEETDGNSEPTTLDLMLDDKTLAERANDTPSLRNELAKIRPVLNRLTEEDKNLLRTRLADIKRITVGIKSAKGSDKEKLDHAIAALEESRQLSDAKFLGAEFKDKITVSIRPIRNGEQSVPLSLMDYMYFTIYTITTTGYGDIVPTTTYAKFLCSVANILEVFFLVVFFNALLSARHSFTTRDKFS